MKGKDVSVKRSSSPPFDVNLVKFFASCGIAILFIFGFTFSHEYFAGFGISLFDTEIGWLQAALIGGLFVVEIGRWALLLWALCAFAVAGVLVYAGSYCWGKVGMYVTVSLSFLLLCYVAGWYGIVQGTKMKRNVVAGKAGYLAACALKESAWKDRAKMKDAFEELSAAGKVRLILQTGDMMYFTFTNVPISEQFHGQAFVVNASDVAFCRVFGR